MHFALKVAKRLAAFLILVVLTIYFVRAVDSRDMPSLGAEQRIRFEQEFKAAQEDETDWAAYLVIEDKLAAELEEKIPANSRPGSPVDRYFADSQGVS